MSMSAAAMTAAELLNEPVYLTLEIDNLRLLLPQRQCIAIVPVSTLQPNQEAHKRSVGLIVRTMQLWPVYALDNALQLTQDPPSTRQHCVLISANEGRIGLLCDRTFPVERNDLTVGPIPECMQSNSLLFGGLAIHQDQIAYISTGDILYRQLDNAGA